jgi:hypothetical protein
MLQRQHQANQWQEQEQGHRQPQQAEQQVPQEFVPPKPGPESDEEKLRRQVREDEEAGKQQT